MFASALGSITGEDNRLRFRATHRSCVVLVDGLGAANLKAAAGHAPFLNSALAKSKPISCGFPSTTATSITSFATGLSAGVHGLIGYQAFDRLNGKPANLLTGWSETQRPEVWQAEQTISQKAVSRGIAAYVVGPPEYEGSGFSNATMREVSYVGAKIIAQRFERALWLLNQSDDCLVYLYVPELDQTAHAYGSSSAQWLERIEELDSEVRKFATVLPKGSAVTLTADHGIVDVPHSGHIYLDEVLASAPEVISVGGDPRVNFVYLSDSQALASTKKLLEDYVGDFALVLDCDEVANSPLYPGLTESSLSRLPELMVLARKRVALYHRGFAKQQSLKMIGQHGSLSHEELTIPLLGWGDYA